MAQWFGEVPKRKVGNGPLAKEIFVLDKESLSVYLYNVLTNTHKKF